MVVVVETSYTEAVGRSYSRYCSRVVHRRMMGWKVATCSPHKLPHDSFLWAAVNTLTHNLEVSVVSNASHDVHFCSIDHYDGPCYHGNTVVLFEVVDFCFP